MHTLDLMEEEHYHACHMNFTSNFVFGMSLLENLFLLQHTISERPGVTQTVVQILSMHQNHPRQLQ